MKRAFGGQQILVAVAGVLLLGILGVVRWISSDSSRDFEAESASASGPRVEYPEWKSGPPPQSHNSPATQAVGPALVAAPSPTQILADTRRHPKERIAVLRAVVEGDEADAFQTLADVIEAEPNFPTRHLLIKALGDTKNVDAVPILVRIAAGDPAVESRRLAVRALENFPKESAAVEALRAAAKQDPDVYVRKNAVRSLVQMDPPELIDCLYEIKTNERDRGVLAMIDQSLAGGAGR